MTLALDSDGLAAPPAALAAAEAGCERALSAATAAGWAAGCSAAAVSATDRADAEVGAQDAVICMAGDASRSGNTASIPVCIASAENSTTQSTAATALSARVNEVSCDRGTKRNNPGRAGAGAATGGLAATAATGTASATGIVKERGGK